MVQSLVARLLIASISVVALAGCACKSDRHVPAGRDPYIPFGPRDIRNDKSHTAVFSNQTVLVPGIPFETRQNEYLRLADSTGRDFNMLFGPYPRLAPPASLHVRNPDVTAVIDLGFSMMMGKQPSAIFKTVRTYSAGTYYIGWINGGDVYVFCENSSHGRPVAVLPDAGEAFAKAELTTGSYAKITGGTSISIVRYFEEGRADRLLPGIDPEVVEFLTYARSRGLAAGLFRQGEYFLGRYENGIPSEDLTPR